MGCLLMVVLLLGYLVGGLVCDLLVVGGVTLGRCGWMVLRWD